jgi:hypothetical protein
MGLLRNSKRTRVTNMRGMSPIVCITMTIIKTACPAVHHQRSHAIDIAIDITQVVIANEHDLSRAVPHPIKRYQIDPPAVVVRHSNSRLHKCVFYCCFCMIMSGIGVIVWRFT